MLMPESLSAPPALLAHKRAPSGAYFATNKSKPPALVSTVALASPTPNVAVSSNMPVT